MSSSSSSSGSRPALYTNEQFSLFDDAPQLHRDLLTCTVFLQETLGLVNRQPSLSIKQLIDGFHEILKREFAEGQYHPHMFRPESIPAYNHLQHLLESGCGDKGYVQFMSSMGRHIRFYLAIPYRCSLEGGKLTWMLMWRTGRIFTIDDIVGCRSAFLLVGSAVDKRIVEVKERVAGELSEKVFGDTPFLRPLFELLTNCCERFMFLCDSSGRLIKMSDKCSRLFDLDTSVDQCRWLSKVVSTEDMDAVSQTAHIALCAGIQSDPLQVKIVLPKNGHTVQSTFTMHPFRDLPSQQPRYWIVNMSNGFVSEGAEEAQKKSEQRAKFMAELSHEIRTPLSGIIGSSALLNCSSLDNEQKELVKTIRVCSKQLFSLVSDFLDLTKLDEDRMILETKPFSIEDMMADCVEMVAPQATEKDLTIILNVDAQIPDTVIGDETRLKQVVNNIVSNAVKFSYEHGPVIIEVKPDRTASLSSTSKTQSILFGITDLGIGIPASLTRGKLFESYVQSSPSIAGKYGGTGLGLSICKKLVDLMVGTIWYESELGKVSPWLD